MIGESRSSPGSGTMSVEEIEHELGRLRMNDDGTLGLRASVLNLIVMTDEESAGDVTQIISRLSGHFPSRTIVLISDPEAEEENLDIGLSAFCSVRGGASSQVCAEQVTIHAEGPPAHHLESLAGPLLLPDLPVFLWYPGPFTGDSPEFEGMASLADRVIVDPAVAQDPGACLREIAGMIEEPGLPEIGDMQWVALSPWRALISELFHAPERAQKLRDIERVEIVHNVRGEVRALLLAGWLASALGWEPESRDEGAISFSTSSGRVTVGMDTDSPDATLRRIRLHAGDLSFQVSRHQELSEARSTVTRGDDLLGERTVRLGHFGPEIGLGEELEYRGRDEAYVAALKMAVRILDL